MKIIFSTLETQLHWALCLQLSDSCVLSFPNQSGQTEETTKTNNEPFYPSWSKHFSKKWAGPCAAELAKPLALNIHVQQPTLTYTHTAPQTFPQ